MGRFYKTSQGNYLDFIYQQPKALLMQAVQVADSQVAQQEATFADLHGRLKFQALQPDTERRDEIIEGYKSQIDNLSRDLIANPLNYRRETPNIRALSDKIKDDMERGEIASIESNYAARQDYEDKLNEQVKAKQIPATEKAQLLSNYDSKFKELKGTQYKGTQNYNPYSTGYVAENVDMFKIVDDRLTGMLATGSEKWGWNLQMKEDGKYLVTDKKSGEVVSEDRVRNAVRDILSTDSNIAEALGTRMKENIQGYDTESVTAKLAAVEDYAMMKFPYEKTKHEGSVKTDDYYKARFDENIKQQNTAVSRNQDQEVYSSLYGGAETYEKAQTAYTNQMSLFKNLTDPIKTQLLKQNGLTVDGQGNIIKDLEGSNLLPQQFDLQVKNYKNALNGLQQALEVARQTGNFKGVQDLEKQYDFKVDKNDLTKLSNNWTPSIADDAANWETKKASVAKSIKNQNPTMTDAQVEIEVAKTLDDVKYKTLNNTIFETQESDYFEGDMVKQNEYVGWLNKQIGANPIDFMTGKGGKLLVQGFQGQGGTPITSNFNQLIKDNYLEFAQNAVKKTVYDPVTEKNVEQVVGYIGGKEVRMTAGKVLHTYEDITGLDDGFKYKQRFTFTDPSTGEVIEASMIQDEDHIPLIKPYQGLKHMTNEVLVAKAGKILTLATQNNQNLVRDNKIDESEAVTKIAEVPGLTVQNLRNGQNVYRDRGNVINEREALGMIKMKLFDKMKTN